MDLSHIDKGQQGHSREFKPCPAKGSSSDFESNLKIESCDTEASLEGQQEYFVPLNSLPPVYAAFRFQRPPELLQLRLVSQDWRRYVSNETLLNWEENIIRIGKSSVCAKLNKRINRCDKFEEPLVELSKLMTATSLNPFPCSQYEIIHSSWKEERDEIQAFLTSHGSRIKKLKLELHYEGKCKGFSGYGKICSHEEKWVTEILTKVLLYQAPNLEEIQIKYNKSSSKQNPCKKSLEKMTIDLAPGVFNTKLRSASISDNLPPSVSEIVCQMAPNLKDFKCGHLNCYIDPVNRLHLLKDLWFGWMMPTEMDTLTKKIANTGGQLHLKKLTIEFPCVISIREDFAEKAEIINKILQKSGQSLKELKMSSSESLPGIIFPRMPKVDTLSLYRLSRMEGQRQFFPDGVRLSDTFPNLTTLLCYPCRDLFGGCYTDDVLLLCKEKQVLTSVREIKVDKDLVLSENTQQWFPNAKFALLCGDDSGA